MSIEYEPCAKPRGADRWGWHQQREDQNQMVEVYYSDGWAGGTSPAGRGSQWQRWVDRSCELNDPDREGYARLVE